MPVTEAWSELLAKVAAVYEFSDASAVVSPHMTGGWFIGLNM